jgi:hypothetical protein
VVAAIDAPGVGDEPAGRLQVLLEEAQASRDLLGIIVRGEGDGRPLRRFTERVEAVLSADLEERLRRTGATPRVDPTLITKLRAAHVVAAVAWFLDHDQLGPAATAQVVTEASERGWGWATGRTAR